MAVKAKKQDLEPDEDHTTIERVRQYETLMPLLAAMFNEFKELSKKKPDGALNKRKIELVNRLLRDVLVVLEDEPTKPYLDLLDEDDVPQNSDVMLILSQFDAAMRAFHNRYYVQDLDLLSNDESFWRTE